MQRLMRCILVYGPDLLGAAPLQAGAVTAKSAHPGQVCAHILVDLAQVRGRHSVLVALQGRALGSPDPWHGDTGAVHAVVPEVTLHILLRKTGPEVQFVADPSRARAPPVILLGVQA